MRYSSALLLAGALAQQSQAGDPSPAELAAQYFTPVASFSFTAKVATYVGGQAPGGGNPSREATYQIWWDGGKWKEVDAWTDRLTEGGKPVVTKSSAERLVTSQGMLTLGLESGKPYSLSAAFDFVRGDLFAIAGMDMDCYCYPLDGRLPWQYAGLVDALAGAARSQRSERVGQVDALFAEVKNKWGEHQVWLDPKRHYLPLRYKVTKRADDWIARDTKLSAVNTPGRVVTTQAAVEVVATKIETVNGRPAIVGCRITTHETFESKPVWQAVTDVVIADRRDTVPDPGVFKFTTDVPNGFPVTVQEQQQIAHVWKDGQVVKDVDPAVATQLGQARFFNGRLRLLAPLAALAALAVVGWFVIRARAR